MKFSKNSAGYQFESKYLTVWQEPTWFNDCRYWGIKFWNSGAEVNLGKLMFRARLNKLEAGNG